MVFNPRYPKGQKEHFFNTFAPFARAQGIYVIALLLACFSWLKMSRGLINTAFYLVGLAFVLHTAGLIFRMVLKGVRLLLICIPQRCLSVGERCCWAGYWSVFTEMG